MALSYLITAVLKVQIYLAYNLIDSGSNSFNIICISADNSQNYNLSCLFFSLYSERWCGVKNNSRNIMFGTSTLGQ